MRGTDARAREHRHRCFGNHRQVDVDAIALLDAETLQHIGELLDLVEEVGVGDGARVTGFAFPVDGDLVASTGLHVTIEAVVRDVEPSTHEPLGIRQVPFADRAPLGVPVEKVGGLTRPEPFVVAGRLVVEVRSGDQTSGLEVGRRRELAVLEQ